jgi:hypothetical protein
VHDPDGALSHKPELLQYPVQQPGQESPQLQVASQPAPMSVHGGGPHAAAGWQVPGPPGTEGSVWQQISPSSQTPCTPPLQSQPSPVHGGGAQFASVVQVPGPPGTEGSVWQQTRPGSQAP